MDCFSRLRMSSPKEQFYLSRQALLVTLVLLSFPWLRYTGAIHAFSAIYLFTQFQIDLGLRHRSVIGLSPLVLPFVSDPFPLIELRSSMPARILVTAFSSLSC